MNSFEMQSAIRPYPSYVLPGMMGEIIYTLSAAGLAAQLVGTVLITIVSLLVQGIADLLLPGRLTMPVGVSGVVVASSGFGKTLALKILAGPVEQCLRLLHPDEGGEDFLIENATRAAIVESLARFPVAGLLTDETQQIVELLPHTGTLIKAMDGSTMRNARVSTGRVTIYDPRFVMLLMMQPSVFESVKHLLGAKVGNAGLGNRFFFAPCSGFGARGVFHGIGLSGAIKIAYAEKVAMLVAATVKQVAQNERDRPAIRLSAAAAEYISFLENDARSKSVPGASLSAISEYLSRHLERVLRLAGAIHIFEYGIDSDISVGTIQCAAALGQWYAEAYAQLVFEPPKLTQAETDALIVERAMRQVLFSRGVTQHLPSDLRAYAPNLGLTAPQLTRALAVLGGQGKVRVIKLNGKSIVELNTFCIPSLY